MLFAWDGGAADGIIGKKKGEIPMEVIAFIGPAGTGKSDRALVVAYENKCSCIIDDGILIYRNRIVAGRSAKKEANPIAAVRRAIFEDPDQTRDVKRVLGNICPNRILILGTSVKMVNLITTALGLPAPKRYIRIEDVAKPEEIQRAHDARHKEGKHVIPVPTMELRPEFKGYLIDPLRTLFQRGHGRGTERMEKSVVRPVFSYYGKLTFANRVVSDLVHYALRGMKDDLQVHSVSSRKTQGMTNGISLDMDVTLRGGTPEEVKTLVHRARRLVQKEIEYTTGMFVEKIRISVTTDVKR